MADRENSGRALRKVPRRIKSEIEYLARYASKLYKEGHVNEAVALSENIVSFAFKNKAGSYAFKFICRRCHVPRVPGLTASYRVKSRGGKTYICVRCLRCGYIRRIVVKHKGVVRK